MNVYDFDGTIYDGDSTLDFYLFCLAKKPYIIFRFPLFHALKYVITRRGKLEFKERFYRFLRAFDDIDRMVERFWDISFCKIKDWYLLQKKETDVVISASPEFLLAPACKRLGILSPIASRVDKKTGLYSGLNCHGEEKVRRFYEKLEGGKIDSFYSDSKSDVPLALLAQKAYMVKKDKITDFPIK